MTLQLYRLTPSQKSLIQSLIHFIHEGRLKEPIGPFPLGNPPTAYAIHLRGMDSFIFENYGDLDALCQAGLMRFSWNRTGVGKLYFVTAEAETAVTTNFQTATTAVGYDVYLPDVVQALSGGTMVLDELENVSLSELRDNLPLRRVVVEALVKELLTAVSPHLNKETYTSYKAAAETFANQLLHAPANVHDCRQLFCTLSFLNHIQAEPVLMAQIHPLLHPLWLIATIRLQ
jgi:hypothetical protein